MSRGRPKKTVPSPRTPQSPVKLVDISSHDGNHSGHTESLGHLVSSSKSAATIEEIPKSTDAPKVSQTLESKPGEGGGYG